MSNYYMYNGSFKDVSKLKPLTFNKGGKDLTAFKLEDLDSLTTTFRNEKEFKELLRSNSNYNDVVKENAPIIIVHQAAKRLWQDEVVYNDKFLYRCAQEVKTRKERGEKGEDIRLYATSDVVNFISRIKQYLLDPAGYSLIVNEFNDPHLRDIIEDFVPISKRAIYSLDEKEFYDSTNRRLESKLRTYSTLRKFVIFEKKYKKLMSYDEEYNKIRTNRDNDSLKKYSLNELINENELNYENGLAEEDLLDYWYKNGGISAVMEHIDVDDLLSYSRERLDRIGLGHLKPEENSSDENKRVR